MQMEKRSLESALQSSEEALAAEKADSVRFRSLATLQTTSMRNHLERGRGYSRTIREQCQRANSPSSLGGSPQRGSPTRSRGGSSDFKDAAVAHAKLTKIADAMDEQLQDQEEEVRALEEAQGESEQLLVRQQQLERDTQQRPILEIIFHRLGGVQWSDMQRFSPMKVGATELEPETPPTPRGSIDRSHGGSTAAAARAAAAAATSSASTLPPLGNRWCTNAPLGDWSGVKVDVHGNITHLRLGRNNLQGKLPSEVGKLTSLRSLELDGNSITGTIPTEIGALSSLEVLWLNDNALGTCSTFSGVYTACCGRTHVTCGVSKLCACSFDSVSCVLL